MSEDRFINAVPNKKDGLYIISFFLLLATVFIFNFLQSSSMKSYGNIYIIIFLLSFPLLSLGYLTAGKFTSEVIYGGSDTLPKVVRDIIVGAIFGGLICSATALGLSFLSFLQVPVPLAVTSIQGLQVSDQILILVVVGIFAVETEEALRASALVPTFTKLSVPVVLLFAGLVTLSFSGLFIATIIFFAAAIITGVSKDINKRISQSNTTRHVFAIVVAALVFALFHVYAGSIEGNLTQLIEAAFFFAVTADAINWKLKSTLAGRIAHSINNSYLVAISAGIDLRLAVLVVGIYALIMVLVFHSFGKVTKGATRRIIVAPAVV